MRHDESGPMYRTAPNAVDDRDARDFLQDGRQLAIQRGEDETYETRGCVLVLNWSHELEQRMRATR